MLHERPPFGSPVALVGHPPACSGSRSARNFSPPHKSGGSLLVHPVRELVPAVPDMFVTPSWFTAATSAAQSLSSGLRAILQHHAITGKHPHARTHENFLAPRADRRYSSACHSARSSYCHPPKGSWKKIPFQSRRRETLGPYRTDERSARIPSTPSDRQRSRGRQ